MYIMNNIIIEFESIFKHEKIITKEECYKYTTNECLNYIKAHNEILFILICEYEAPKNECVINYYNNFWGNKEFNELLKRFNLCFEWYDTYILIIYYDFDS